MARLKSILRLMFFVHFPFASTAILEHAGRDIMDVEVSDAAFFYRGSGASTRDARHGQQGGLNATHGVNATGPASFIDVTEKREAASSEGGANLDMLVELQQLFPSMFEEIVRYKTH
eukprot:TRINITY_DN49341_c0_g1_i1.p1 TRINITY_DN49341_c0_g1~~TRINITY_DN49341_c0_g1_i1.p1  ORF type:complete len:117 (-),score=22.59 TRINITY_DN49341_c0_g1_i1:247-597(-)